jgi:hypothetical protein
MIDQSDILKICGQAIVASGQFPRIVWPNSASLPAKPYVVIELRPRDIQDRTLRQTAPVWAGTLTATIVTALDKFDTEAQTLAKAMAELFPAASRLTLTSGQRIAVSDHPTPTGGYRDGADWRQPVNIPLRADG